MTQYALEAWMKSLKSYREQYGSETGGLKCFRMNPRFKA